MQLHDAQRLPCSAFYSTQTTLPVSEGERVRPTSNETNRGRIRVRVKLTRKGKANADFNRKNGGNGDADRDGPDWPALC